MAELPISLAEVTRRQDGLFAYEQALRAGLSPVLIHRRTRTGGPWQRVASGVFAVFTGALSDRQRYRAALLHGGRSGRLSHATALQVHRVKTAPVERRAHVSVPITRHPRSEGFIVVHRTRRPGLPASVSGFAVCPVEAAVVDTVRAMTDYRSIRALVAEVLQRQLTTLGALHAAAAADRSATRPTLLGVLAEAETVRSAPEAELLDLLRATGLPQPAVNEPLVVGGTRFVPDFRWGRVILEVDSQQWHADPTAWGATLARHNLLTSAGYVLLHVTPADLRREPERVLRQIAEALRRHGEV